MLELDLDKVLQLQAYPNYRVEKINDDTLIINYFPPSISDASGLEDAEASPRYYEIIGKIEDKKVKIIKAEIVEGDKRRKLDESELELWAEYLLRG